MQGNGHQLAGSLAAKLDSAAVAVLLPILHSLRVIKRDLKIATIGPSDLEKYGHTTKAELRAMNPADALETLQAIEDNLPARNIPAKRRTFGEWIDYRIDRQEARQSYVPIHSPEARDPSVVARAAEFEQLEQLWRRS